MKYVHPADRMRPWVGLAVGLAALVGMLAFGVLGRDFGALAHLKAINIAAPLRATTGGVQGAEEVGARELVRRMARG